MPTCLDRSVRLLSMVRLFESGARVTTAQLARRYGVDQRTVQRDLLALQGEDIWLPLVEDDGVYRLMPKEKS